jgi:hypothetical protein
MHNFNFIQFFVTICFFYIEALIHYNIGKKGTLGISFPKWKQNKLIISVIAVFSFASCIITRIVEDIIN